MTKEALKLALEALEVANSCVDGYYIPKGKTHLPEIELAITAIKEALANEALEKMAENARELGLDYEPEQEPVAWRYRMSVEDGYWVWNYATYIERQKDDRCEPLYTTPPQRTWVNATTWRGLTDEEVNKLVDDEDWYNFPHEFAKAVETALRRKNT